MLNKYVHSIEEIKNKIYYCHLIYSYLFLVLIENLFFIRFLFDYNQDVCNNLEIRCLLSDITKDAYPRLYKKFI